MRARIAIARIVKRRLDELNVLGMEL
jgi:hypothetical protein